MPKARLSILSALLASSAALMLVPGVAHAAGHTQTLRVFDKAVSMKLIHADGTVVTRAPFPEAQPGDVLEMNSLDYSGDHAHHSKRFVASSHLRCVFGTGAPTCESQVAIGNSLLIFTGNPGTVTDGTGIYQGASGRVVSAKQVGDTNNTDIVARIRLR